MDGKLSHGGEIRFHFGAEVLLLLGNFAAEKSTKQFIRMNKYLIY